MKRPILALALLTCQPLPAYALRVPAAYQQVALEYDVPAGILFSIAMTESGRQGKDGQTLPYPWTMNVDGKAFYLASKQEADAHLERLLALGKQPDIGLMQVNWRYHQHKLGNIRQAFETWRAGDRWVQINPSPAYMVAVDDTLAGHPGLPSNPPNTPAPSWAQPETYCIGEDIPDATGILAAVWQMADRAAEQ